jgi:hypothetical protein
MPKTTRASRHSKKKSERRENYKNRVGKQSKYPVKPKDKQYKIKPTTELEWINPVDEQEMREEEWHMTDSLVTWHRPSRKSFVRYVIPGVLDNDELNEISRKHPDLFNYLFQ